MEAGADGGEKTCVESCRPGVVTWVASAGGLGGGGFEAGGVAACASTRLPQFVQKLAAAGSVFPQLGHVMVSLTVVWPPRQVDPSQSGR